MSRRFTPPVCGAVIAVLLMSGLASCSSSGGPCEAYNDYYDEHIQTLEGSLAENPVEWQESQRLLAECKSSGGDPSSGYV